jgi:hypothetical protein
MIVNNVVGHAKGQTGWGVLSVHGFLNPFEIGNFGAMVSIISILTT